MEGLGPESDSPTATGKARHSSAGLPSQVGILITVRAQSQQKG